MTPVMCLTKFKFKCNLISITPLILFYIVEGQINKNSKNEFFFFCSIRWCGHVWVDCLELQLFMENFFHLLLLVCPEQGLWICWNCSQLDSEAIGQFTSPDGGRH